MPRKTPEPLIDYIRATYKYLSIIYCAPVSLLGPGHTAVNKKKDKNPCPCGDIAIKYIIVEKQKQL